MSGAKGQRHGWCGAITVERLREYRERGMTIALIAGIAEVQVQTIISACVRYRIVGQRGGARYKGQGVAVHENKAGPSPITSNPSAGPLDLMADHRAESRHAGE